MKGNRGRRLGGRDVVSSYSTNFPHRMTLNAFRKKIGVNGKMVGVFIPNRVEKLGKEISFVQFKDVMDNISLQRQLDKILIEVKKIGELFQIFERRGVKKVLKRKKSGFR